MTANTAASLPARSATEWLAACCTYGGGLVIGLTLVSFPASSGYFKAANGFSDAEYGAIYLPQLIAAIIGAVAGGMLSAKWGLRRLFLASLVSFAAAQGLLASTVALPPGLALGVIMCATAFFGFGFGFGGGPLNAFVALLFPRNANAAITALHMVAGAGLTIGPFIFAGLTAHGQWVVGSGALFAFTVVLFALSLAAHFPEPDRRSAPSSAAQSARTPGASGFFWITALMAIAYSIAEGTFSNWAVLYAQEDRGLSPATAALALTAFWAALTLGRLFASLVALRVPSTTFLAAMPLLMIVAFWTLPSVATDRGVLGAFALAGLACSAFFPMLVGFAAASFPTQVGWVASMLTAAMMVGVGIGSFAVGALRATVPISDLYRYSMVYPVLLLVLLTVAMRSRRALH